MTYRVPRIKASRHGMPGGYGTSKLFCTENMHEN